MGSVELESATSDQAAMSAVMQRARPERRLWRPGIFLFGGLVAMRVAIVPVALALSATNDPHTVLQGDVRRYHEIATHAGTPYRDFTVEYPPVMLAAIEALDAASVRTATVELMWSQLAVDLGISALVFWGWGRRASIAYLAIGAPFMLYPFIYLRLDLLSVALAVLGLALLRRRRAALSGVALAVACFAKVWPMLLAPLFVVRRSRSGLVGFLATGAVGVTAWVWWAGSSGPRQVLTLRGARGWEAESLVGSVLNTFGHAHPHIEQGAPRIGLIPGFAVVLIPIGIALSTIAIWWIAAHVSERDVGAVDGLAPLSVIAVFLVLSPIISPQYLCWLVPFAAIASAGGEPAVGWITASLVALSTLDLNLVKELLDGDARSVAVVDARNLLLVVAATYFVARLVVKARASRSMRLELLGRNSARADSAAIIPEPVES